MNRREDESDRVDWLDLGPDPDEGRPPRDPRRRYLWYGALAGVAVLALVLTRTQHSDRTAAAPGSPTRAIASSPPSSSAAPLASTPAQSFVDPPTSQPFPSRSPVLVSSAGHRLLDVPADWELFARTQDTVIRIQLAAGRVSTTATPASDPGTPVTLFVGADRVFVQPQDGTASFVIVDGKQAAPLPPPLSRGATLLPGPDQRHLWTEADDSKGPRMALLDLDGTPTGTTIPLPTGGGVSGPDGAGYLLMSALDGDYYDARPGSVHRITHGVVLATGPTRWLTVECDDSLSCAYVVIDRASGTRHRLATAAGFVEPNFGTISPDGRTVALPNPSNGATGGGSIRLLDLDTGAERTVDTTTNGAGFWQGAPPFVWSPDSRWLFFVDFDGQVMTLNRATGTTAPLDVRLPVVTQLALRHRTG